MPRLAAAPLAVWAAAPGFTGAAAVGVWACAERMAIEEAASEATPPRNERLVWVTARDGRRRGPRKSSGGRDRPGSGYTPAAMTLLDWLVVLAYFAAAVRGGVVGHPQRTGHRRRLLPGRPQPRLVRRRRVDLRLEHRLGAPRRPGRRRRHERRRARALRAARLVPAGARLGARAVLPAVARLHDAGVPRAALLAGVALGAVADLAGRATS